MTKMTRVSRFGLIDHFFNIPKILKIMGLFIKSGKLDDFLLLVYFDCLIRNIRELEEKQLQNVKQKRTFDRNF